MAERGIRSRFATPKLRDWQTSCHRKVSLRIATGNPHPRISGSNIHSQSIIIQFYIFFGSSIRNLARSESFTTLACHLSTERLKIERRASAARRMAERGIRLRSATPKLLDWQTSCHRKVSLRTADVAVLTLESRVRIPLSGIKYGRPNGHPNFMAEREGFEPSKVLPPYRFSRAASSTTPASLHILILLYIA